MEKKEIIELGINLGLIYNISRDNSEKYVIFEGCEGQTFMFMLGEPYKYTLLKMGEALINFGRKQKALQILEAVNEI